MKDFFRLTFSKVSKFDYDDYYHDFVQCAPFWIFRCASLAHKRIENLPGFSQLYSFLQADSAICWRNPELYPHLFRILKGADTEFDLGTILCALECHLGLRDLNPQAFTHRYFRLHRPIPQTFELAEGEIRAVPQAIVANEQGFPLVYQPVPHLFDDVVGGAATYIGSPLPVPSSVVGNVIREAAEVLRQYDSELYDGFTDAVGTLAITGEWDLANRSSYSTGSLYTGGIFTSLCVDSPQLLVESFIHEYYHQRLWMWWLIEAPSDIPDREMTVVSPVSGHERSVQIMMQALLIYASLTDYYRWAYHGAPDKSDWIGIRWKALQEGTFELLNLLRRVLAGRDDCLRFVNAIAEYA
jgi:hypothetical protein